MSGTATATGFGDRSARLAPPRIGPRSSQLSDRARSLLNQLDAVFHEEGFAHLTVGELATRLKCSRRTLYEIAPSKDELVLVVLDRRLRRIGAIAAEHLATIADPADRLEAFMLSGSSELKHTTLRFREDVARFPAGHRLFAAHFKYATAIISGLIDDGIAEGRFRPMHSRVIAEIIDAAFERLQDPELLRSEAFDFEDAVGELTTLLRFGLALDGTRSSRSARARS